MLYFKELSKLHYQGGKMVIKTERAMDVYQFTVIIERQPKGEYLVSVPALPGCYTEGRTLEEAREMATDSIRAYCTSLLKHGEPIPIEPSEEQFIGRVSVALEPV
jgi:predicted RNase H-like HicB family nuclease